MWVKGRFSFKYSCHYFFVVSVWDILGAVHIHNDRESRVLFLVCAWIIVELKLVVWLIRGAHLPLSHYSFCCFSIKTRNFICIYLSFEFSYLHYVSEVFYYEPNFGYYLNLPHFHFFGTYSWDIIHVTYLSLNYIKLNWQYYWVWLTNRLRGVNISDGH